MCSYAPVLRNVTNVIFACISSFLICFKCIGGSLSDPPLWVCGYHLEELIDVGTSEVYVSIFML